MICGRSMTGKPYPKNKIKRRAGLIKHSPALHLAHCPLEADKCPRAVPDTINDTINNTINNTINDTINNTTPLKTP
ncbi:hypothetical protein [Neobacillus sp. NPDC093127]|uniref:hypothetical protein n=1 Tax=Neobacillus sp. NPDC093127 TaxID=3364296 RepID=UPI0038211D15